MKRFYTWMVLLSGLLAGCKGNDSNESKPLVVTTTSIIADALKYMAGNDLEIHALMGSGVDPHIYKASQGDVALLTKASLIVHNGLHLEGKMSELFHKLEATRPVVAVSSALDPQTLRAMNDQATVYDPHIWFDPDLWLEGMEGVNRKLQELYPDKKDSFQQRFNRYKEEITSLNKQLQADIKTIPEENRVLITSHDAFGYYGQAFGLEVHGLQGISTVSEFGIRDLQNLSRFIIDRKIRAVFVESSVSPKSIEALIENCRKMGHEVRIGGELFSDALGEAGTAEGTYTGMLKHNTRTIIEALK